MAHLRPYLLALLVWAATTPGAHAGASGFEVGDAMPQVVAEHFLVSFSIACSDEHSARVDRYEHGEETAVVAYKNVSKAPYGYFMVHNSTLLLDNEPQDGVIDRVAILSPEKEVQICGALPE